jgi:hypothetical protein
MNRPRWAVAVLAATALAASGCGSQHPQADPTVTTPPPPSLALATGSSGATWASLVMGGSAADYNNFWQLFDRSSGSARWQLVTPPGMASNGGFVLAGTSGQSLVAGFRPSQNITYSPLVSTADNGTHWSTGQVATGLAAVPDALATGPGSGSLIALGTSRVELSRTGGSAWTQLATLRSLAATTAGRRCQLTRVTAVTFSPAGTPLAAGTCAHPGVAGIFAYSGGGWQAAGPTLPAALAGRPVTVLRLSTAGNRETALLAAGSRDSATVVAAWSSGGSAGWSLSPSFATDGRGVLSASLSQGGSVGLVLSGGRGVTLSGPGARWRTLPLLPPHSQALALGPGSDVEALAGHRTTMTVWSLPASTATAWATTQVIKVPIPYGSSS